MGDIALMLVKTLTADFKSFVAADQNYKDEMRERIVRVESHIEEHVSSANDSQAKHLMWAIAIVGATATVVSSVAAALITIYLA